MDNRHLVVGFLSLLAVFEIANATEKANDKAKAVTQQVITDRLYVKGGCSSYLSALTPAEQEAYARTTSFVMKEEVLYFVTDQTTLLEEVLPLLKAEGFKETGLVGIKNALKGQPYLVPEFKSDSYRPEEVEAATSEFQKLNAALGKAKRANKLNEYVTCAAAELGTDIVDLTAFAKDYHAFVMARPNQASVGYFDAKVNSCKAVTKVGTGNQFAEPKSWDGSRFYIVDASFKNTDTESRLPAAGSLFINYNGKDYKFDSVEPVMLEGYNIWFKQINPLVTMKTKLVYRIPDEIEGEVFWGPGRNPEDVRLYCGQVVAKVTK